MSSHPLPRAAAELFSHVVADNAPLYRAILDVFAASKRQFRLHLRPDDVLAEAAWPGSIPTADAVQQALGQLNAVPKPTWCDAFRSPRSRVNERGRRRAVAAAVGRGRAGQAAGAPARSL